MVSSHKCMVRRGCQRSFEPREQKKKELHGAKWGCTGAEGVSDGANQVSDGANDSWETFAP